MTESNTEAVTKDERAAPEIYVWFAESKSSLAQGERFIRAWTDNPDRVENLRKAIGLDPVTYRDNGADAASTDDVIDLAVALEQKRALHIVAAVRAQGFAKSSGAVPTQAESVFDLACEEIEHRLRTETWEIGGVTGPLPEERTALTSDVAQAPVGYVSRAAFTEISQGSQQWAKLFSVQSTGTPGNMVPVYAAPVAPTPETAAKLSAHDALRYMACRDSAIERGLFATPEEYDAMVDDSLRKKGKEVLTGRGNNYGKKVAKDGSLYRVAPTSETVAWRVVNDSLCGRGLALHRPFVLKHGDMEIYAPDGRIKRWKSEVEAQRVCNRLNSALAATAQSDAEGKS